MPRSPGWERGSDPASDTRSTPRQPETPASRKPRRVSHSDGDALQSSAAALRISARIGAPSEQVSGVCRVAAWPEPLTRSTAQPLNPVRLGIRPGIDVLDAPADHFPAKQPPRLSVCLEDGPIQLGKTEQRFGERVYGRRGGRHGSDGNELRENDACVGVAARQKPSAKTLHQA